MPTDEEWAELRNTDNCSWTWTTIDGVNGYKVQSNKSGYKNNWIFLPAAGCRNNARLYNVGLDGDYWSSSLNTGNTGDAYDVFFNPTGVDRFDSSRYVGQSIRPVSK